MSPWAEPFLPAHWCFPRVSGDEPHITTELDEGCLFSPRERG